MACCAFALFILGQLAAGFEALRRAVPFGLLGRPSSQLSLNPAAAWRLGEAPLEVEAPPARWLRTGRVLALAGLLDAMILGGAALWALQGSQPSPTDTIWCSRIFP
jgi:hypothetical protein